MKGFEGAGVGKSPDFKFPEVGISSDNNDDDVLMVVMVVVIYNPLSDILKIFDRTQIVRHNYSRTSTNGHLP